MNINFVHAAFHKFICASNALLRLIPSDKNQKAMLKSAVAFSDYSTFQFFARNPNGLKNATSWDDLEFALAAYEWIRVGHQEDGNHWVNWWSKSPWEAPKSSLHQCRTTLITVLKNRISATENKVFEHRILETLKTFMSSHSSANHPDTPSASDIVLENFKFSQEMLPWVLEKCISQNNGNVLFCSEGVRDAVLHQYWDQVDWITDCRNRHNDWKNIAPSWKYVIKDLPHPYLIKLFQDHPQIIKDGDFPGLFAARPFNEEITQVAVENGLVSNMLYAEPLAWIENKDQDTLFACVQRCQARREKRILSQSINYAPVAQSKRKM